MDHRLITELENIDDHIGELILCLQTADMNDRESVIHYINNTRIITVLTSSLLDAFETKMSLADVKNICLTAQNMFEVQDFLFDQLSLLSSRIIN